MKQDDTRHRSVMNTSLILSNPREARGELDRPILDMERDSDFDPGELFIALQHAYHYLNTSWNSRFATEDEVASASDADIENWQQFPRDLEPGSYVQPGSC